MNTVKKNTIALTLGAVVVGSASFVSADVQANPFEFQQLVTGYQLDAAEGKCGEGKCGESKMKAKAKGKCGEGKCGESKMKAKAKGKCGEGKCGEGKAKGAKEGKCGE